MEKNKMEKKSWKDHGIVDSSSTSRGIILEIGTTTTISTTTGGWLKIHAWYGADNYLSEFSWPPRSYTCRFCKREFRSVQALGGHMNVHRRDRACRLRQSPPAPRAVVGHGQCPKFLNLSPKCANPNFTSFSSLPSSTSILSSTNTFSCTLPYLVSPSSTSLGEKKKIWDHDHLSLRI